MSELTALTLTDAVEGLRTKRFSAEEITRAHLTAIEGARALNAFTVETPEKALEMARASDARIARGEGGPLEGAPLGIKDLFSTEGVETTAGSRILQGFKSPYESTVTANLWRDGAVMLGKLNMDEFAMGSSNETSAWGPVVNPHRSRGSNAQLTPGGSSGGSAAAVAADLCLGATASDTGGSIRQPAAFTGTVGIKPTYGRCSRFGHGGVRVVAGPGGADHPLCGRRALMLRSMSGHDPKDSTSLDRGRADFTEAWAGREGPARGVPREYRWTACRRRSSALGAGHRPAARRRLRDRRGVSPTRSMRCRPTTSWLRRRPRPNLAPLRRHALRPAGRGQVVTEVIENTRAQGFGDEVKRRVLIGTYVLSAGFYDAYYIRALKVRRRIADDFDQAWTQCDALLTPSTPTAAFALGDKDADPVTMYLNDVFTVPANLAGLPGISVPTGLDGNGLPLGLQLVGRALDEETLFSLAGALEAAAAFRAKPEKWWS
jgi:aspartyl-tRNA(Asn)/glutamyl-tRNA(Gln) amidotransferase subunit A